MLDHSAKAKSWRPLLDGAAAKKALEAVDGIADEICKSTRARSRKRTSSRKRASRDASLAGGAAGLAVFYAYLGHAGQNGRYEAEASRLLEESADALASRRMDASLYGGFPGVAWAMVHVGVKLGHCDGIGSTQLIDAALENYLCRPDWRGDYDLVIGLVGLGVYALERLPAHSAVACLEGVVDRLDELSERQARGITWHTPARLLPAFQRKSAPRGYHNLGLAHGVPGAIALLGAAWAAGVRQKKARRLLDGAVDWLLAQELEESPGARFPGWITPGKEPVACRSAWCYGDPGVAAALFCAARSVGRKDWEREALEIARGAALRQPEEAGVTDATLCHGAAGLGHIFNRLHQATGDETLAGAARFWFERTLAMRRPGRGVGGFSAVATTESGRRKELDDSGIVTGAAGIALTLLAATTSVEPEWDRMLLVSNRRS